MPMSGKEMLKLFKKKGWIILRQKGSHVTISNGLEKETIPMHREIKKGLEKKLLKVLKGEK
ncbi:type II toxin-antitoxin system HicA family toxin [bacterium]|nr:type II toxin-antitoxin system HicA family toxin [bacterium]